MFFRLFLHSGCRSSRKQVLVVLACYKSRLVWGFFSLALKEKPQSQKLAPLSWRLSHYRKLYSISSKSSWGHGVHKCPGKVSNRKRVSFLNSYLNSFCSLNVLSFWPIRMENSAAVCCECIFTAWGRTAPRLSDDVCFFSLLRQRL